MVIAVM